MNNGQWISVDASRRLILDVLHLSASVPCFPVEKWFALDEVRRRRMEVPRRISWPVLFAKAYGQVAREIPELRRVYQRWPWPHFYQYQHSVATIAVHRVHANIDHLFWARLSRPEATPLDELQKQLDTYQTQPVQEIFRRHLLMARFPTPLRRLLWWFRLNTAPRQRARRMGTFGMSTLAGQGVYNRLHPHFLTSSLSYGPLQPDGRLLVTLLCDHRVLDGALAARAINRLEQMFHQEIAEELAHIGRRDSAKAQRCA